MSRETLALRALALRASALVAIAKQKRWPAGAPSGKGGQFAPEKGAGGGMGGSLGSWLDGMTGGGGKKLATGGQYGGYGVGGSPYKGEGASWPGAGGYAPPKPKPVNTYGGAYDPKGLQAPQFGIAGYSSIPTPPAAPPKGSRLHTKTDDNGNPIVILKPSYPSKPETWNNPTATAAFVPGGKAPDTLNGVAMKPWNDRPKTAAEWNMVEGQNPALEAGMPPLGGVAGKHAAAGVIIREPDGRMWVTEPTNHYGGYRHTFPKGTQEKGLTLQATAIKETWEETGLKVRITGVLGDFERTTSVGRYYIAERVGGTPSEMGWESQAMKLAPAKSARSLMNMPVDADVMDEFEYAIGLRKALRLDEPAVVAAAREALAKAREALKARDPVVKEKAWKKQPRWPGGSSLGGQWKAFDGDGIVLPPKIGSATNPQYGDKAAALYKAAKNKDIGAVKAAVSIMLEKAEKSAAKTKTNSHDKWNAQTLQYAQELQAQLGSPVKAVHPPTAAVMGTISNLSSYKKIGAKPGGSNPGGMYQDAEGKWLVKGNNALINGAYGKDVSERRARNEVLMAELLLAAGAGAPKMKLVDLGNQYGGGIGVASGWVDGVQKFDLSNKAHVAAAQQDFALHAWLANYDALGMGYDNTVIKDGKAYCIDTGGAGLFRAQGLPKSDGQLMPKVVNEWENMRDPAINPYAGSVYGSMTASQLKESAQALTQMTDAKIRELVGAHMDGDGAYKKAFADRLIARRDYLLAKAGIDPLAKGTVAAAPIVAPVATPEPAAAQAAAKPAVAAGAAGAFASAFADAPPAPKVPKGSEAEKILNAAQAAAVAQDVDALMAVNMTAIELEGKGGTSLQLAHELQDYIQALGADLVDEGFGGDFEDDTDYSADAAAFDAQFGGGGGSAAVPEGGIPVPSAVAAAYGTAKAPNYVPQAAAALKPALPDANGKTNPLIAIMVQAEGAYMVGDAQGVANAISAAFNAGALGAASMAEFNAANQYLVALDQHLKASKPGALAQSAASLGPKSKDPNMVSAVAGTVSTPRAAGGGEGLQGGGKTKLQTLIDANMKTAGLKKPEQEKAIIEAIAQFVPVAVASGSPHGHAMALEAYAKQVIDASPGVAKAATTAAAMVKYQAGIATSDVDPSVASSVATYSTAVPGGGLTSLGVPVAIAPGYIPAGVAKEKPVLPLATGNVKIASSLVADAEMAYGNGDLAKLNKIGGQLMEMSGSINPNALPSYLGTSLEPAAHAANYVSELAADLYGKPAAVTTMSAGVSVLNPPPAAAATPAVQPKAVPTAINVTHLNFSGGKSDKFWKVAVVGNTVVTHWGKNGTTGQASTKTLPSQAAAEALAGQMAAAKKAKGYESLGNAKVTTPPPVAAALQEAFATEAKSKASPERAKPPPTPAPSAAAVERSVISQIAATGISSGNTAGAIAQLEALKSFSGAAASTKHIDAKIAQLQAASGGASPVTSTSPKAVTPPVKPPSYGGGTEGYYNSKTIEMDKAWAAGDLEALKQVNIKQYGSGKGVAPAFPKTSANGKIATAYHNALVADLEAKQAQGAQKANEGITAASGIDIAAVAAPAAKAAVVHGMTSGPFAMPAKPKVTSPANPNLKLQSKVDAIEQAVEKYHQGTLTKSEAAAAIGAHTFGSNSFNQKAKKYQADALAALGGTPAGEAVPPAPAPKTKFKPSGAPPAGIPANAQQVESDTPYADKYIIPAGKFDAAKVPPPPDFTNWSGAGKPGPSSKAWINQSNQEAAQAIYALGQKGDAAAIKSLQVAEVDYDTGKLVAMVPAITHKSQHIKGYAQQTIEEIENQTKPSVHYKWKAGDPVVAIAKQFPALPLGSAAAAKVAKVGNYLKLGTPAPVPDTTPAKLATTQTYAAVAKKASAAIPATQIAAVKSFTGDGSGGINKSCWDGNPSGSAKAVALAIKNHGHAIEPGTLLSRRIGLDAHVVKQIEANVGSVLQEPAPSSTAVTPTTWDHGHNVQLRLKAGPGVRALYVGPGSSHTGGAISKHSTENEVILPPGWRMLVTKVTPASALSAAEKAVGWGGASKYIVDAILLPTDDTFD